MSKCLKCGRDRFGKGECIEGKHEFEAVVKKVSDENGLKEDIFKEMDGLFGNLVDGNMKCKIRDAKERIGKIIDSYEISKV